MNRLLLLSLLTLSLSAYSKNAPGGFIKGGDTTKVTFDISVPLFDNEPNFNIIQYKIKYIGKDGKKKTLLPADADEIWFQYDGEKVRMITNVIRGSLMTKQMFLRIVIDGPMRLYRFYYTDYDNKAATRTRAATTESSIANYFYYQKGTEQPTALFRKEHLHDYFKDCPGEKELIDAKGTSAQKLVNYYNENCASKQ